MNTFGTAASNSYPPPEQEQIVVLSALFSNPGDAQAAIQELREVGIPAENISLISRDEDHTATPGLSGVAGVSHEDIGDEALAYRASSELPNDEDLPTTVDQMTETYDTGSTVLSGNSDDAGNGNLGLTPDRDMVRRNEAETNADEDIYTDFPNEPGGINPASPIADRSAANIQEPTKNRTEAAGNAAIGVGLGSMAGLLAGMAGLAIPGIGPLIAAGPLAAAISSIVTGGAAGGIIGALSTAGVPQEYARRYAAGIEQGQTLISVQANDLTQDLAERILIVNGGEEVYCG